MSVDDDLKDGSLLHLRGRVNHLEKEETMLMLAAQIEINTFHFQIIIPYLDISINCINIRNAIDEKLERIKTADFYFTV